MYIGSSGILVELHQDIYGFWWSSTRIYMNHTGRNLISGLDVRGHQGRLLDYDPSCISRWHTIPLTL